MQDTVIACADASQLARSLRTWRVLRRIKQHHAGELLGVSQGTVSRWESRQLTPSPQEQDSIRTLLAAHLDSAADRELARLVSESSQSVHLVCDVTHRLLAVSRARERAWRIPRSTVMGKSLWPYATEEIAQAEAALSTMGWFEPAPPEVAFHTGTNHGAGLLIRTGWMRWIRFQLSDGSFARLVESVRGPALPGATALPA